MTINFLIISNDMQVLRNLRYTNAVIMETLRRWPAIPGFMPRYVTNQSVFLSGYSLPQNVKQRGLFYFS